MPSDFEPDAINTGYYNLQKLIIAFGEACGNWFCEWATRELEQ
jgi:hypothetical protein